MDRAHRTERHLSTRTTLSSTVPSKPEEIEVAIYRYIVGKTDYLTKTTEKKEQRERLLKHYIELYAHNPDAYPNVPGNEIHQTIRKAGSIVLRKTF